MLNKVTSKINNSVQGDAGYSSKGKNGKNPNFTGALDVAMMPLQWFEQNPMLNVSLLDCTTAIGPRTYQESKTNIFAGFEAFRRESSGLIVNCLIPSAVVYGVAKLLGKSTMGYNTKLAGCWANEETVNVVSDYWNEAQGEGKERIINTFKNIINDTKGVGDKSGVEKSFGELIDFDKEIEIGKNKKISVSKAIEDLAEKISNPDKVVKDKDFKDLSKAIIEQTHVAEEIKLGKQTSKGFYNVNFQSVMRDTTSMLNEFTTQKAFTKDAVDNIAKKAVKLVNRKSGIGLSAIIALALSMQPINRFITEKVSGKKGAPIYKDFATDNKKKELSSSEKSKLWFHKILSAAAMCGVAFVAMKGKLPDKKMLQFSGIFPTMDQARVISTATFASRILSAQDENDRREATIRDIGTFSALYFLGDYAAKAVASLIEKISPQTELLNSKKALAKGANLYERLKHWAVDTSLKSTEEVVGQRAKSMRSLCQLGNILFSFALLGTIIPKVTRHMTDKHHEADMKASGMTAEQISKYYRNYPKTGADKTSASAKAAYRPFFTSDGATSAPSQSK